MRASLLHLRGLSAKHLDLKAFCTEPTSGRLFKEQYDFLLDPAKFKLACNSRRSGKTIACCADLIITALGKGDIELAYITLSRKNAKRIVWRELKRLVRKYEIPCHFDNAELTITFTNHSIIHLFGANDETAIEDIRGNPYFKVYIDEAQAFKPYLRTLIFDVLSASLFDHDGKLILIGTPAITKAGVFFDACQGASGFVGFKRFTWNLLQNPFLEAKSGKPPAQLVAEDLALKGLTEDSPWVQREIYGRWVEDSESRVYKFTEEKNLYETLPGGTWYYVLGVDIGFEDPDACAVWAYNPEVQEIYLVEEYRAKNNSISTLAGVIQALNKRYRFTRQVIDAGALGKKINAELKDRFGLHLEAADKTQKLAFIELMNDDFRRGKIKVKPDAAVLNDWRILCWDRNHQPPIEDQRFSNDLPDACLYGWRECRLLLKVEPPEKPKLDADAQMQAYWQQKAYDRTSGKKEWWEQG